MDKIQSQSCIIMVSVLSIFHYRNNLTFAQRNMKTDMVPHYRKRCCLQYWFVRLYIYIAVPFVCVCLLRYSNTLKPPLIVTHIHVHLRYMQLVMCFNNGAVMTFIPPLMCVVIHIYILQEQIRHTPRQSMLVHHDLCTTLPLLLVPDHNKWTRETVETTNEFCSW